MYPITIETKPDLEALCVHATGDYMHIGKAFETLMVSIGTAGLVGPSTRFIGVYFDAPDVVPKEQLRAAACAVLGDTLPSPDATLPTGVERYTIQAGECAVLSHTGPYDSLPAAYEWLFGTWLPESGRFPADAPPFEEYLNDPRSTPPPELRTEIFLPLKPAI
ncbi:MAG: AraC family transcriptional regulator [Rhodospirillaceae bacterium]